MELETQEEYKRALKRLEEKKDAFELLKITEVEKEGQLHSCSYGIFIKLQSLAKTISDLEQDIYNYKFNYIK